MTHLAGFPIGAGDQVVGTNPLFEGSKRIEHLATSCTATRTSRSFDKAGLLCQGTFFLGKNTLVAAASITRASRRPG